MESQPTCPPEQSLVLDGRIILVAAAGTLSMAAVCVVASPSLQIAFLGTIISILIALVLSYAARQEEREEHRDHMFAEISVPWTLASHPEWFSAYSQVVTALCELANQPDEILRETALLRVAAIQQEFQSLSQGKVIFSATEAWRTVYEQILRSPGIRHYRSVAWIRNEDYWRDVPGRRSMELNYDLLDRGIQIERTLIVCDFYWPPAALLPSADILPWIDEQHRHGLAITLVRESAIEGEPDLLCDFGIYGDRSTGFWETDDQNRTLRFTLDFSTQSRLLAEERWRRLSLYTISYVELLDRAGKGG